MIKIISLIVLVGVLTGCKIDKQSYTTIYSFGSTIKTDSTITGSEIEDSLRGNQGKLDIVPL